MVEEAGVCSYGRIAVQLGQTACHEGACHLGDASDKDATAALLSGAGALHLSCNPMLCTKVLKGQLPVLEVNEVLQQPLACALHLVDDQAQALSL